jgi:hypothetical protein
VKPVSSAAFLFDNGQVIAAANMDNALSLDPLFEPVDTVGCGILVCTGETKGVSAGE